MRVLYQSLLCPESRAVRICLAEKKLDYHCHTIKTWDKNDDLLNKNPAGTLPVLQDGSYIINDIFPIFEYLEDMYKNVLLFSLSIEEKIESRRLIAWFLDKFKIEVTYTLLYEKTIKRFAKLGVPCSLTIRKGKEQLEKHLDYIGHLADKRKWLAGDTLSYADILVASHISCHDYLGDINWTRHPFVKEWYMKIKSRPSFRDILKENIPGIRPVYHYAHLDF